MMLIIIIILFNLLLIKYMILKRQIRKMAFQAEALLSEESEKMIDIALVDKDLERLAGIFNRYNEKQRLQAAAGLRREERLKEAAANMSHDLRTPLTVIIGHLQLLKKQEMTKAQAERVEIIYHKAQKMKALAEAFYEISLLETGNIYPKREKFNFSNLLMELMAEYGPILESKGLWPEIDMPEYSLYLFSDIAMTERILQNLLTNAVRYSAGTIKIKAEKNEEGRIAITIENPISEDEEIDADRLFERFYTGDRSRHLGGTGLGLSVVKLLVQKLGGYAEGTVKNHRLTIRIIFNR